MIRAMTTADRSRLEAGLKRLKLRRMREILDESNELANQEEPAYIDYLAYLVDREVDAREATQLQKRVRTARFPELKRLDEFDFSFQTSVSKQTMAELAGLDFIRAHENICLCGPSGVGKSHLGLALGYEAAVQGYRVAWYAFDELIAELYASLADGTTTQKMRAILCNDLIILDELGYVSMDQAAADHIFQLVSKAYERRSLIITTNLDFGEWGDLFGNRATATAVLDRFLHHAHVIVLKGDSYRMRSRLLPQEQRPQGH